MANELRAFVHAQMGGRWLLLEDFLNGVDSINSFASSADTDGQIKATVFIHNIEELQSAFIHRPVELKVDPPHVVRIRGSQQLPGTGRKRFRWREEGPLEPLSRQIRCTRLWFTFQPSIRTRRWTSR